MACFRTPGEVRRGEQGMGEKRREKERRGVPLRMSACMAAIECGRRAEEVICNKSFISRRVNWLRSRSVRERRDDQRSRRRRVGIEISISSALASYYGEGEMMGETSHRQCEQHRKRSNRIQHLYHHKLVGWLMKVNSDKLEDNIWLLLELKSGKHFFVLKWWLMRKYLILFNNSSQTVTLISVDYFKLIF